MLLEKEGVAHVKPIVCTNLDDHVIGAYQIRRRLARAKRAPMRLRPDVALVCTDLLHAATQIYEDKLVHGVVSKPLKSAS